VLEIVGVSDLELGVVVKLGVVAVDLLAVKLAVDDALKDLTL
jgi:hypothetical protein